LPALRAHHDIVLKLDAENHRWQTRCCRGEQQAETQDSAAFLSRCGFMWIGIFLGKRNDKKPAPRLAMTPRTCDFLNVTAIGHGTTVNAENRPNCRVPDCR